MKLSSSFGSSFFELYQFTTYGHYFQSVHFHFYCVMYDSSELSSWLTEPSVSFGTCSATNEYDDLNVMTSFFVYYSHILGVKQFYIYNNNFVKCSKRNEWFRQLKDFAKSSSNISIDFIPDFEDSDVKGLIVPNVFHEICEHRAKQRDFDYIIKVTHCMIRSITFLL